MTNIEENKKRGRIRGKYIITKSDGTPVDPDADYFVLRLDLGGGDPKHIRACRRAIIAYARAIQYHLPMLARDLDRYDDSVRSLIIATEVIHAKHGKARGLRDQMPCPVCKDGVLTYAIAGSNGHINARCSDAACVSFIQ